MNSSATDDIWAKSAMRCLRCGYDTEQSEWSCGCRGKDRSACACGYDGHHRSESQHRMAVINALDNGLMIKVVVGGEHSPRVFSMHETLLRSTSAFCDKALSGYWKESKNKKIDLPDEDPTIFDIYQRWLLLDKILIGSQGKSPLEAIGVSEVVWDSASESDAESRIESEPEPEPSTSVIFNILLECYILGDHLLDADFKNTIIDNVASLVEATIYPKRWITVLPQKLPESSGLRRLFEDVWVDTANSDWIVRKLTTNMDETTAFFVSLTKKVLDSRVMRRPRWYPKGCRCKYYENAQAEEIGPNVSNLGD